MYINERASKNGAAIGKDLAIGAIGTAVSLPLGYLTMQGAERILHSWGMGEVNSLGIVSVYKSFVSIPSTVLKILLFVYSTIFVPIFEEWVFRSKIYECQESKEPQKESWLAKSFRVISNGLLFGLIHLDPLHMIVASITGMVFALLREITGSWRASAISHSLNNTFIMSQFLWA